MADFVYVLGNYDEYGLEDVAATTDRSVIRALLHELISEYPKEPYQKAIDNLSEVLAKDDADLAERTSGTGLTHGWGGPKLYVMRLQYPKPERDQ